MLLVGKEIGKMVSEFFIQQYKKREAVYVDAIYALAEKSEA